MPNVTNWLQPSKLPKDQNKVSLSLRMVPDQFELSDAPAHQSHWRFHCFCTKYWEMGTISVYYIYNPLRGILFILESLSWPNHPGICKFTDTNCMRKMIRRKRQSLHLTFQRVTSPSQKWPQRIARYRRKQDTPASKRVSSKFYFEYTNWYFQIQPGSPCLKIL